MSAHRNGYGDGANGYGDGSDDGYNRRGPRGGDRYRSDDRTDRYRDERPRRRSRSRERDYRRDSRGYDSYGGPPRGGGGGPPPPGRRGPSRSPPRGRKRSPESPPGRKGRSVTPVHLKKRKLIAWDVPPPGYEGMTAAQVKQTGLFPLPGQPARAAAITGPGGVLTIADLRSGGQAHSLNVIKHLPPSVAGTAALNALQTSTQRQAKRLYIGNVPTGVSDEQLKHFFNTSLKAMNLNVEPGDGCLAVTLNTDKNFAFVEFRTNVECTGALAFDGIQFSGQALKIRRPKDYMGGEEEEGPQLHVPGVISTVVAESPNKVFVGGLPTYLTDGQVIELLKTFGELRSFNLVKDASTNASKGFAFCEFLDVNVTELAINGLNGLDLGDKKLIVQRAITGAPGASGRGTTSSVLPQIIGGPGEPTPVLLLLNMVSAEELDDAQEYNDIVEDIRDECSKFGEIRTLVIPRPVVGQEVAGVGKVFIHYATAESSQIALKALAGRRFGDRTVVASYYPLDKFMAQEFS
ncbi:hypothetical protein SeLEV6574_g01232 [Synchytrium endobioticum]|nr:hypothetical protein SeLEV6574_g01232 [Synchytrium endobioticum]